MVHYSKGNDFNVKKLKLLGNFPYKNYPSYSGTIMKSDHAILKVILKNYSKHVQLTHSSKK